MHADAEAARRALGRVLVDQGVLTEAQLVAALAQQIGMRFVELADFPVDHSAVGLVSGAIARRYVVLPFGFEDGKYGIYGNAVASTAKSFGNVVAKAEAELLRASRTEVACQSLFLGGGAIGSQRSSGTALPPLGGAGFGGCGRLALPVIAS